MTKAFKWLIGIMPVGLLIAVLVWRIPVQAQDNGAAQITSPQSGEQLIGVVTIQGTASSANFQRYKLEFSTQENEQWFTITEVSQQVTNGPLAQWNTAVIPDGLYQIRLRVILRDGNVVQNLVQNLAVSNQQPTPLPTVPLQATPLPPTLPPTAGPSPTSIIQQPPSAVPPPTLPNVNPTAALPDAGRSQAVIVVDALRNAFCSGVYLALIGFGIVGVYRLAYSRLRHLITAMRSEER
jgi:hypothetical protein